jgi:serine/threonine protein kinase
MVHLHSLHIAHRNIQMENILLTQQGQVKIIGFELSCDFSTDINNPDKYGQTVETLGMFMLNKTNVFVFSSVLVSLLCCDIYDNDEIHVQ